MLEIPNWLNSIGITHTIPSVIKEFVKEFVKEFIKEFTTSVPSLLYLINVFEGNMRETYLDWRQNTFWKYFEAMFLTGSILDSLFDRNNVLEPKGE